MTQANAAALSGFPHVAESLTATLRREMGVLDPREVANSPELSQTGGNLTRYDKFALTAADERALGSVETKPLVYVNVFSGPSSGDLSGCSGGGL